MTSQEVLAIITARPDEFMLGYDEGLSGIGMTYDDDSQSERSIAYDLGRSLRQGMSMAL